MPVMEKKYSPHYPCQALVIQDGAVSKPCSDPAGQDALDSPSSAFILCMRVCVFFKGQCG